MAEVDQAIQQVEVLKASPETPKCPTCGRIKLKGEKCGCEKVAILKVDLPNDGLGVFTYLKGYKYPMAGFADQYIVDLNAIVKRTLIASIRMELSRPYIFTVPILFLFRKKAVKRYMEFFAEVVDTAFKPWKHPQTKYPQPLNRFCKICRELLRVGDKYIGENMTYRQFFMALIMVIEFDTAYRYRAQDVLQNINQENLKKNWRKELIRLLELGLEREKIIGGAGDSFAVQAKWKFALTYVKLGTYLWPGIFKKIVQALSELNVEEFKYTPADWYYCSERWDYEYGGIPYRERLAKKIKEDEEWVKTLPPEPPAPTSEQLSKPYLGYVPSESFWDLSVEAAEKLMNDLRDNFLKEFKSRKVKI